MRVVAVIQARMGSTRLPGKVLLPLAGKPMLQNIVDRVKRAKLVDGIVVAHPSDDFGISELVEDIPGCHSFSNMLLEENDLVSRFYMAASAYGADLIVRICSDNPLVEPGEIDRAIQSYMDCPNPYISNMHQHDISAMRDRFLNGYPDGVGCEVFSWSTLQWMNECLHEAEYREHPHRYFHRVGLIDSPVCPYEFARPNLKLDVNEMKDYEFIKDIYEHFGHNNFHITEVIKYLDSKNQS